MGRLRCFCFGTLLFVVSIVLFGCDQKPMSQQPTANSTISPVPVTPTVDTSLDNTCNWPPEQVSTIEVSDFYWSIDGENLIYREKGENQKWYMYTIVSRETSAYFPDVEATTTPIGFDVQTYIDLFISPDEKHIIYTQPNHGGYDVYLRTLGEKESVLLGTVKGRIDQSTWLSKGTKLILSINWSSPLGAPEAYVYLVDILAKSVEIIIPHSAKYADITYLGLTPDEAKIMFISYSEKHRLLQFWELATSSSTLTKTRAPLTFKWLPNNKEFIGAGYQNDSQDPFLYVYNIEEDSIRYLLPFEIKAHPFIKNAIQISPLYKSIAFIEDVSQSLKLIDCSPAIQ